MSTKSATGLEPYDPDDITVYGIDWVDWLTAGQTITGELWTISPSAGAPTLVPRGTFADNCTAFTFTGGGTAGTAYTVTCQATKSNGEKKTRSFTIQCREA